MQLLHKTAKVECPIVHELTSHELNKANANYCGITCKQYNGGSIGQSTKKSPKKTKVTHTASQPMHLIIP